MYGHGMKTQSSLPMLALTILLFGGVVLAGVLASVIPLLVVLAVFGLLNWLGY